MYQPKRRKKRFSPGLRTVELARGKAGYGFTITGQQPCMLSFIVEGSPADRAGLKARDRLISINGQDVSEALHDDVIRIVGSSSGVLVLQIEENYTSSDSSDDDYLVKHGNKYSKRHQSRPYPVPPAPPMHTVFNEFLYPPSPEIHYDPPRPGRHHDKGGHVQPRKMESKIAYGRVLQERNGPGHITGRHMYDMQLAERKKIKQLSSGAVGPDYVRNAGATKHTLITRDGRIIKSQSHSNMPVEPPEISGSSYTPKELSNILNPLIRPQVMSANSTGEDSDSELNDSLGPSLKAVVGYIGSVELPRDAHLPSSRLPSIRNAIRRLRMERKVHTLVQLEVFPDGVRLVNNMGSVWARYPRETVAFAGVYPDDTRYFGIVTLQGMSSDELSSENSFEEYIPSSACHVFLVDPDMHKHSVHAQKAIKFGIQCSPDPLDGTCRIFPQSATDVATSVARLYRDREDGLLDSTCSTASNQDAVHDRSSSSSTTNSSNNDSGVGGFGGEEGAQALDCGLVVNLPRERPVRSRDSSLDRLQGQRASTSTLTGNSSDNSGKSSQGTDTELMAPPKSTRIMKSISASSREALLRGSSSKQGEKQSSSQKFSTLERLNVRAMPDPKGFAGSALRNEAAQDQNCADNLRSSAHKLLQGRQQSEASTSDSGTLLSGNTFQTSKYIPPESERDKASNFGSIRSGSSAFAKYKSETVLDRSIGALDRSGSKEHETPDKLTPRALPPHPERDRTTAAATFQKKSGTTPIPISIPTVPDVKQAKSVKLPSEQKEQPISEVTPFKPPRPERKVPLSRSKSKTPAKLPQDRPKSTPPLHFYKTAPRATISECESDFDDIDNGKFDARKMPEPDERRYSEGWVLLKKKDKVAEDLDTSMPEVKLGGLKIRPALSSSHESLVVSDDYIRSQGKYVSSAATPGVTQLSPATPREEPESGNRVASWAVSFDRLLRDEQGIVVFTEFLKKEYSEENIVFWTKCEEFKKISDPEERKKHARAVFDEHLSSSASEPVNVDSNARKEAEDGIDEPLSTQFNAAQTQIFQLMKTDSYSRFLKSDLYKQELVAELEGKSSTPRLSDQENKGKDNKKPMKKSKSVLGPQEDKTDEKRRKSLLPWKQAKGEKKVMKVNTEPDLHHMTGRNNNNSEQVKDANPQNAEDKEKRLSNGHPDLMRENTNLCRVLLPDGSTTIISAKPGLAVREACKKLFERRNLKIVAFEVVEVASEKLVNIDQDISSLTCKEIRVERRVVFRVDLPNRKSIGLRAKPEKTIRDVFKPALHKYGHKFDEMIIHLAGSLVALEPDTRLSTINGQRIYVQSLEDFSEWGSFGSHRFNFGKPPVPKRPTNIPSNVGSSDDNTNQMFKEMMEGKTEILNHFDDNGILDPDVFKVQPEKNGGFLGFVRRNSLNDKDKPKVKVKPKPGQPPQRPPGPPRRQKDPEEERFIELLTRVQSHRLDDQRGLTAKDFELPDFLRLDEDNESEGKGKEGTDSDAQSIQSATSCASEPALGSQAVRDRETLDDAFIRDVSALPRDSSCRLQPSSRFISPSARSVISHGDQSFSTDGHVPTHQDAENYFSHCHSAHGLEESILDVESGLYVNYGKTSVPKAPPRKTINKVIAQSAPSLQVNQTYVVRYSPKAEQGSELTEVLPTPPKPWISVEEDLNTPDFSPPTPLAGNGATKCDQSGTPIAAPRGQHKLEAPTSLPLADIDTCDLIIDDNDSSSTPSPTTHDLVFSPDSPPSPQSQQSKPVPKPRVRSRYNNDSGLSRSLQYEDETSEEEMTISYV